ncbi:intestinal mucin-like protein [Rhinoraja longicauda]
MDCDPKRFMIIPTAAISNNVTSAFEIPGVCSGWGGSHYLTFDGTSYTFKGNCTYILVKQITEKFKDFKIYLDNAYSGPDTSHSAALKIFYNSSVITLIQATVDNSIKATTLVNNEEVIQPYSHDGVRISSSGITEKVEIITINVTVTFNGLDFTIDLPYEIFGKNVEGQCGTCTNNKKDDCTLPDGTVVASCSHSASHWIIKDKNCGVGTTTPRPIYTSTTSSPKTTLSPTTVPTTACAASDICKIILGPIFSKCHDKVPPGPFYEACVNDACHVRNETIICSSLDMYSKMCRLKGDTCVDWRNHTSGVCSYHCPAKMEYKPCASKEQPTCGSRTDKNTPSDKGGFDEGCFCPDGKILFEPKNICTDSCNCIGPDGKPKQVGETWQSNCQDCSCVKATLSIICKPHKCPISPPVVCKEQGFVPVVERNQDDLCCTETTCKCNTSHCTTLKFDCKPGYTPVLHMQHDKCCPNYTCKAKQVCVYNGTEYKPGMTVPQNTCKDCKCTEEMDPLTKLRAIACTPNKCNTQCSQGYEYKKQEGQCCGNCTQVSCIIELPDRPPIILQPGEKISVGKNNCTKYECEKIGGHFIPNIYNQWCPRLDHDNCEPPGDKWLSPNDNCTIYGCMRIKESLISTISKAVCPDFHPEDCEPISMNIFNGINK